MSAMLWHKLYHTWWTTPSHRKAGVLALGYGVRLLGMAQHDELWRETGWACILNGDGTPMSEDDIAFTTELRKDTAVRYLNKLTATGTLQVGYTQATRTLEERYTQPTGEIQDGYVKVYWFPKFRKWQEDPSTTRKRSSRTGVKVPPNVTVEEKRRDKKRGESDSRGESTPKLDLYGDSAKRVLSRLNDRRQEVVPGARNLSPTKSNLKEIADRLKEGESEETLLLVVDAAAEEARGKPDRYRWLNPTTPFRVSNMARYVALADKPKPADEGGWL